MLPECPLIGKAIALRGGGAADIHVMAFPFNTPELQIFEDVREHHSGHAP
jgi:hypothetical protein